jgi:HEAT repeat protein
MVALLVAGACQFASVGDALADGVLTAPGRLSAKDRGALVTEVDKARAAVPTSFAAVASLRAQLPELDADKRGRLAPITPMLKSMGTDGLFPMLSEIALDAQPRAALSDSAWTAWRVGLLEAVGSLRDPRSAPVLVSILDGTETDFAVVKAAAEALGKVGTDAAASKLIAMAKRAGPKQQAVLAGMGDCRRERVANHLATVIAGKPDADTAKLVIRALGNVGSAPAWRTSVVAVSGEETATRAAAAKALVGAFVAYSGELRQHASNAIMVVDDPSTVALITAAKKTASGTLAADLDKLATRFAKNPTR